MDIDGNNQRNLTKNPGAKDSLPAWSPDGQKIALRPIAMERWKSMSWMPMEATNEG